MKHKENKVKYSSNAKWTKIGESKDIHETREMAQGVCDMILDNWGNGMPPCEIRGACLKAWVEEETDN